MSEKVREEMTVLAVIDAGDKALVEAVQSDTVRRIVAALEAQDGPGSNAWMQRAAKWIRAGAWKGGPGG